MGAASIPVDLANPGQVFACLGFVEAADILLGVARGGFDWRDAEDVRFRIQAEGDENPVARVLRFFDEAAVVALAPHGSENRTEKWKVETVASSREFPFRDPQTPATLPARLRASADKVIDIDTNRNCLRACARFLRASADKVIDIDYWGDETRRDNVKFWAGAGGYPGAALTRDALDLIRRRTTDCADDPFALATEQSSSFRFDWRRDYVPIDAGFSLNQHGDMVTRGYPIVELMAAVGLTHARPLRRQKLEYRYGVAGVDGSDLYDPIFLRAALGARAAPFPGMPFRSFTMRLGWPGQEGQARCITNVVEETASS